MLVKVLTFFIIIIISKALYNLYYFWLSKRYFEKYLLYLDNKESRKNWYISENKHRIISVLTKAGLKNVTLPNVEPVGYGYVSTAGIGLFENLSLLRKDIAQLVGQFLKEAKGVYWHRFLEAFSPIFWFEFVIFLPKKIFSYLGFAPEGLFVKIVQVIWWLISFASAVIGIVFNKEFTTFVQKFLLKS